MNAVEGMVLARPAARADWLHCSTELEGLYSETASAAGELPIIARMLQLLQPHIVFGTVLLVCARRNPAAMLVALRHAAPGLFSLPLHGHAPQLCMRFCRLCCWPGTIILQSPLMMA